MKLRLAFAIVFAAAASPLPAQPFNLTTNNPELDRWMYAHFSPTSREVASVFGWLEGGVDTRMAQYLIGFDTYSQIATNRGAKNYLVRSVRLTLVGSPMNTFVYDPSHDSCATYFATNEPGYQPDADEGRPVELFGAGFRNGFTAETFAQDSGAGGSAPEARSVFAAGYTTNGILADVSNNVGKTNAEYPHFEVYPFAVAQTTNAIPGATVPGSSTFTFDLDLSDPLVRQYVQEALNTGRLRLIVSSLHFAELGGDPIYPAFNTHFSPFGSGPIIHVEGTAIGPDDADSDSLPDDWEQFYFSSLAQNGNGDPDHDGQSNLAEYRAGADPTSAASRLEIVGLQRDNSGVVTFRFPFAASHNYDVEYSGNMNNWTAIENPTLGYYTAPGQAEWHDDGSQTDGPGTNRFYRIRVK